MEDEVKLEALELLDRLKRHYLPELHTLMNDCNYVKNKLAVNNSRNLKLSEVRLVQFSKGVEVVIKKIEDYTLSSNFSDDVQRLTAMEAQISIAILPVKSRMLSKLEDAQKTYEQSLNGNSGDNDAISINTNSIIMNNGVEAAANNISNADNAHINASNGDVNNTKVKVPTCQYALRVDRNIKKNTIVEGMTAGEAAHKFAASKRPVEPRLLNNGTIAWPTDYRHHRNNISNNSTRAMNPNMDMSSNVAMGNGSSGNNYGGVSSAGSGYTSTGSESSTRDSSSSTSDSSSSWGISLGMSTTQMNMALNAMNEQQVGEAADLYPVASNDNNDNNYNNYKNATSNNTNNNTPDVLTAINDKNQNINIMKAASSSSAGSVGVNAVRPVAKRQRTVEDFMFESVEDLLSDSRIHPLDNDSMNNHTFGNSRSPTSIGDSLSAKDLHGLNKTGYEKDIGLSSQKQQQQLGGMMTATGDDEFTILKRRRRLNQIVPFPRKPKQADYNCSICNESYQMTVDQNPWWAIYVHECPKCRQKQIPRIDIHAANNAIELDPNVIALYGEGIDDSGDDESYDDGIDDDISVEEEIFDGEGMLNREEASKLLVLMCHARTCTGEHQSPQHAEVCKSTKFLMLHLRDCRGVLASGEQCTLPWCAPCKRMLQHLTRCFDPASCSVCNPFALSESFSQLRQLNTMRVVEDQNICHPVAVSAS